MTKKFLVTINIEDSIDAVEARDDVWYALAEKNDRYNLWDGFTVEEVDDEA